MVVSRKNLVLVVVAMTLVSLLNRSSDNPQQLRQSPQLAVDREQQPERAPATESIHQGGAKPNSPPPQLLAEDVFKHGNLPPSSSGGATAIDVVIPFDGELSPKELGQLLKAVKDRKQDAIGLIPQWNEQLRLTLRSLQKHLLCVPRNVSKLTVDSIRIVARTGSSLPSWLRFGRTEGDHPQECIEGNLASAQLHIVNAQAGTAPFNQFNIESRIAGIPSLAPHFLYFPTGTVFSRPVTRDDLFEPLRGSNNATLLLPRAVSASEVVSNMAAEKMMKRAAAAQLKQKEMLETTHNHLDLLFPNVIDYPVPPLFDSIQVINTYTFTHYASGHSIVGSPAPEQLMQLSSNIKKVTSRNNNQGGALASRSISPLILHDAVLVSIRRIHADTVIRSLRHRTVKCWSAPDAVETLQQEFDAMNDKGPLTLRLIPSIRHPFWMDQFLWEREVQALNGQAEQIAEVMGLVGAQSYFEYEKSAIAAPPSKKTLFPATDVYPEPQDPLSNFPCGPLRVRRRQSFLPSEGAVNDLLPIEGPSTSPSLPRWDASPSDSASAATVASMMCWYPGRPPHAFPDEVPEVTAAPKLSQRVNRDILSMIAEHKDETSENTTVKNHRLATVDMIYTFVKGDAPKWLKAMRATPKKDGHDLSPNRIRDWDELRYSLRSVKKFFCRDGDCCGHESGLGLGAIYIVVATEEHIPEWLQHYKIGTDDMEKERDTMSDRDKKKCRPPLRIITHDMIFPGAGNNPAIGEHTKNEKLQAEFLPTYNSNAIESCLHRIPGLRPYYVYLNNDFLFGRNVFVNDFFRPVLRFGRVTLEPLIAVEHIAPNFESIDVGLMENEVSKTEMALEAALFQSDPERYDGCTEWPIRHGVNESIQGHRFHHVNQWIRSKMYNGMLVYDRLEGMELNRKHSHISMMFHRDTMHRMQEVDFADISHRTRKVKFREIEQLTTEFTYMYYASAHHRARKSGNDPSFCVNVESFEHPVHQIEILYRRWNHWESFEVDRKWRYHWFYMVTEDNIEEFIEGVKNKKYQLTTFLSVNDNFPPLTDDMFDKYYKLLAELMNLLVSNAPPSWFEKEKDA